MASLTDLEQGSYVIVAKAWVEASTGSTFSSSCQLTVGGTVLDLSTADSAGDAVSLSLAATRTLTVASTVRLQCRVFPSVVATAKDAKLIATRVTSITD